MEVLDVIKNRRSIRSYLPKPVEEEKLRRVLEAGRLAPSANNKQEWRYIVVRDEHLRKELKRCAYSQRFVDQAPVIIAACAVNADYVMTCGQLSYTIDVAISVDHMTLQAVEEGLGTCWIGKFDEEPVKKLLGIPDDVRVVQLLALGYPERIPSPTSRKPLEEIVKYDRW